MLICAAQVAELRRTGAALEAKLAAGGGGGDAAALEQQVNANLEGMGYES